MESTEISPEVTTPDETPAVNDEPSETETPDIGRLIAEAEQRGYLRGRNEAIGETIASRPLWENSRLTEARVLEQPDPASLFLSSLRPDVWD